MKLLLGCLCISLLTFFVVVVVVSSDYCCFADFWCDELTFPLLGFCFFPSFFFFFGPSIEKYQKDDIVGAIHYSFFLLLLLLLFLFVFFFFSPFFPWHHYRTD